MHQGGDYTYLLLHAVRVGIYLLGQRGGNFQHIGKILYFLFALARGNAVYVANEIKIIVAGQVFIGRVVVGNVSYIHLRAYRVGFDIVSAHDHAAAVESGVKMFVFSSTAATFGQPESIPIRENDRQLPINPYGESKLCFEKILKWYREIHGMNYAALRYFNAAGATPNFGEDHRPETHLIPLILQTARGKREKLMLYGDDYDTPDGTCIRDYIHILDLAQAHELALSAPESGHYNLGTGNGLSVREIINAAEEVTGLKVKYDVCPRRPGDPARLIACSDRARSMLKWQPKYESAHDIIESAWKWQLKHPEGYAN